MRPPGSDYKKAVALKDDETVAVSWISWPDRATRDAAWEKLMEDERLKGIELPFVGKRMVFGGFEVVLGP